MPFPFTGDYGISKNPESFAVDNYRAYFTDKQRGAVLSYQWTVYLTPISDMVCLIILKTI